MAGTDNGAQQGAGDPGQQSTNPSPDNGAQQGGPKGQPDEGQKQKRESYEARIKDLEEQLKASKDREASLNADLEKALSQDDVNAAVKEAQEKAKAASDKAASDWAAREKMLTVTNALLAAGCSDTVAVLAHLDMNEIEVAKDGHISGLDTAKLAESYPYLFRKDATNTQTLSSAGTPGGAGKKITKAEIVAIKDPQERRRLIAENKDLFE